jgi:hypothetical protein
VRDRGPTLREVAARRGMSAEELAVQYMRNLDIRDAIVHVVRQEASAEELRKVRERGFDAKTLHALAELYGGYRGGA